MKNEEIDLTTEQINNVVKKLGGPEGVRRFLRGETVVVKNEKCWRKENGIIYFTVTSDGTSGKDWINRLEEKSISISKEAKRLLLSDDFKPTSGEMTEIIILKSNFFSDNSLTTAEILSGASELGYTRPNAEVACLIRDLISDEEMIDLNAFHIIPMHEPIKAPDLLPGWLVVSVNCGDSCLHAAYDLPDPSIKWSRSNWFAFVFIQINKA